MDMYVEQQVVFGTLLSGKNKRIQYLIYELWHNVPIRS